MVIDKQKGAPENARLLNRALIFNQFKNNDKISRADLTRTLGLSKVTISVIVSDLIDEGLLCEMGIGKATERGGRRPILLALPESNKYVIGVDIGRTNLAVAIGNLKRQSLVSKRIPTRKNHAEESILEQIKLLVEELLTEADLTKEHILGAGLSIGGLIDSQRGYISYSPDFNWENIPFKERLEAALGVPCVIDNCTRVMALGEKWSGNDDQARNIFFVNAGHGIGSAIIINNRIYQNNSEFGHIFITKKEVHCDCGKMGCLESVASGHAIEKAINQHVKSNEGNWYSAKDAAFMATEGNAAAKAIFNEAGKYLGRALSIIANLFNPDKIVIGGGVANAKDLLLIPLMEEFRSRSMNLIANSTSVELAKLGIDTGIHGAVCLALDQYVFHSYQL